jgi:hypothetical protein
MKRIVLLYLLILPFGFILGADYSKIDTQSQSIPNNLKTPEEIAKYLTRNLHSNEEKVRAIYYWIANNIRYDVSQVAGNDYRSPVSGKRNFLKEVLDSHKGVCQHYALLFDTLCHSVGIKSYFIIGYTLQSNHISELSHAWNAVMVNGDYYEFDVTWSAGYIESGKFRKEFHDDLFMVPPSKFISTHIPFDPVWQFLKNPITHFAVGKGDFSNSKTRSVFNYSDSIKEISTSDTLTNLIRENQRIKSFGVNNPLIRNYVAFNQRNIDLSRYNIAVHYFNKSVENYNSYIENKNQQFNNCTIDENTIVNLLASAKGNMENARKVLLFLSNNNNSMKDRTLILLRSINKMNTELVEETEFVKKYISTPKPLRLDLFSR